MIHLQKTYEMPRSETTRLVFGDHLLRDIHSLLREYAHTGYVLLCDETTKKLYADEAAASLRKLGAPIHLLALPKGEREKSMKNVMLVLDFMLKRDLDKKGAVVALGGGVVGDIATAVAGLYRRGIECVQIPSTLLAQVDSAYGGKGGVNVRQYKNMVGLIHHPILAVIDTSLLSSLPQKQIRSGLGEILKYAIALDKPLFETLERTDNVLEEMNSIVRSCAEIKMGAVTRDPLDTENTRVALNFGHTLGHAVEIMSRLTHGEAVALGMAFAISVSRRAQILSDDDADRALRLIRKFGLPLSVRGVDPKKVREIMEKDKKNIGGKARLVLLGGIGLPLVKNDVEERTIGEALQEIML